MTFTDFVLWKQVKKWRSDKVLAWVKPATSRYSIIIWRRVNPRYAMQGGHFDDINAFQFVEVQYARTRLGAQFIQATMGRDKWTDGFKQQVVEILDPGESLNRVYPPSVSFDDYPTPDKLEHPYGRLGDFRPDEHLPGCLDDNPPPTDPDLVIYGKATSAETEGELYEKITGHSSKPIDDAK